MSPLDHVVVEADSGVALPSRATSGSAGYDLRSNWMHPVSILPHQTRLCPTGLRMKIPHGYAGLIYSRSGLAKDGLVVANGVGVIDSDYRGEIGVLLHNDSDVAIYLGINERVAQMVFTWLPHLELAKGQVEVDTSRGDGGFGSTGK